ncbi:hypothetical protein SAMN04488041_101367 [Sulfitobacter pontiacus]|uniref:Uncharacterized protein n=1 Tax=Sulfitobacter pontiacus TaxID=60137 RepID=A0A1H2R2S8_9RHOB|nr:hypothetical protein [Sulfitobacter pontiacus]SDW13440.1 hypothetical protein SAMN04488041_101367 [Sulfitobacter pontiacus]
MSAVASKILGTVNAPYGANLSAHQLASCISSLDAMKGAWGPVFSFFTEVKPDLQMDFIKEMGIEDSAKSVAAYLQGQCANPIPLAL